MALRRPTFRSATAFFLVTFSTAFLMTVGMRLTGWFTKAPESLSANLNKSLGVAIMIAVITLGVGASIRRMDASELRSALLGAASVLLALPLSEAAIAQQWNVATSIISGLGFVMLVAGVIVSLTIETNRDSRDA